MQAHFEFVYVNGAFTIWWKLNLIFDLENYFLPECDRLDVRRPGLDAGYYSYTCAFSFHTDKGPSVCLY